MQNTVKREHSLCCSQFELTTEIITKLNTFKITPTAKLVLLYLTTCYNPDHTDVFPKQKTISDKLGISERSVTRAIQELFKEGLILIECKYTNRYKFTPRIVSERSDFLSDDIRQKDGLKTDKLSPLYKEQKRETKKEQTENKSGGNVYSASEQSARAERSHVLCERSKTRDDEILREYAIKHGARNIEAYVTTLKQTKSAEKIISEYKRKNQRTPYSFERTLDLLRSYEEMKKDCVTAKEAGFIIKK